MGRASQWLWLLVACAACRPQAPPCPWPDVVALDVDVGEVVDLSVPFQEQGGASMTVQVVGVEDSTPGVFAPLEDGLTLSLAPRGEAVFEQHAQALQEGTFWRHLALESTPACRNPHSLSLALRAKEGGGASFRGPEGCDFGLAPVGSDRTDNQFFCYFTLWVDPTRGSLPVSIETTSPHFGLRGILFNNRFGGPPPLYQVTFSTKPGQAYGANWGVFFVPKAPGVFEEEVRVRVGQHLERSFKVRGAAAGPRLQQPDRLPSLERAFVPGVTPTFFPSRSFTVKNVGYDAPEFPGVGTAVFNLGPDGGVGRVPYVIGNNAFSFVPQFPVYMVSGGTRTNDQVLLAVGESCTLRAVGTHDWLGDHIIFGVPYTNPSILDVSSVPWPACAWALDVPRLDVPTDGGVGRATFTNTGDAGCQVQNPLLAWPPGPFQLLSPLDDQRFVDAGESVTFEVSALPGTAPDAGATLVFGATSERVDLPVGLGP